MPAARSDDVRGVVYTPPSVARPMVELALAPLLASPGADAGAGAGACKTAAELLELRVCDPAIGEGAFLEEVVAVLAAALAAARLREGAPPADPAPLLAAARRDVVARCIAGVDVDAAAVAVARQRLGADARALHVGDALALDWAAAFPEAAARGGFDAIVGNPPYIRQESLGAPGKAAARTFQSYDGVADLYVYFLELAHRIARRGGRYCLITPSKWLTAAYARPLRAFLAAQGSVEGIVDLARAPLFAGADAFPSIVWGTVGAPSRRPIRAARVEDAAVSVADALRDAGTPHARERWRDAPWHIDAPAERALIERLERAHPALGAVLGGRPMRGVVTGCNRAFVIDAATRARLLAEEPAAAPLIRPFVKGRDVRRWLPDAPSRWILLVDRGASLAALPRVAAHLAQFRAALEPRPPAHRGPWPGRKPGAYRWYELQDPVGPLAAARAPRLFYQDIQTGPACAIDRGGELVPDTTVWILPSADLYLLAVLNSPLYGWYARRRFPPALNGSVRPKLEYVRALPIAVPAPAARTALEALVAQRLAIEDALRARRGGDDGGAARATATDDDDDDRAAATARELDAAIEAAVLAVYELSPEERALIAAAP
ncbi:MAG TPA: Eco57I restriction-modification methylase domain-containing protein [Kofleriaceae bacterium]|nr:Eco57I restriction-modification methylase domain-containing protein [Kofleriaceae bacterium]